MIGQRVRRREDPRFLTGQGRYVDDLELDGRAVGDVRALRIRPRHDHRDRHLRAARRCAGVHRRRRRPRAAAADASGDRCAHGPAPDRRRQGPVRRRDHRDRRHRHARDRASTPPSRCGPEMEPLPAITDEREAIKNETLLFEEAGTNVAMADGPTEPSADLFDGCERRRRGRAQQPADPRRADRAARDRGGLGERPAQHLAVDPDAAPGPGRAGHGARGRARPRARDRARRRRRLRRQGAAARGRAGGVAGAQARPAGALDRDALRAHGRDGSRPRPADVVHARWRPATGSSRRCTCGCCRTQAPTPASARSCRR